MPMKHFPFFSNRKLTNKYRCILMLKLCACFSSKSPNEFDVLKLVGVIVKRVGYAPYIGILLDDK